MELVQIIAAPPGSPYSRGDILSPDTEPRVGQWVEKGYAAPLTEVSRNSEEEEGLAALKGVINKKQIKALEEAGYINVAAIAAATLEELEAVKGISRATAEALKQVQG